MPFSDETSLTDLIHKQGAMIAGLQAEVVSLRRDLDRLMNVPTNSVGLFSPTFMISVLLAFVLSFALIYLGGALGR